MHDVKIKKVNRGFMVTVGCQQFVFEKENELFSAISEYFSDPLKAEKKYVIMGSHVGTINEAVGAIIGEDPSVRI